MSLASEGKLIAKKGKFLVIGVDTFEGPTADYKIGEYSTKEKAIEVAKERGGTMNITHVYDDKGTHLARFGTF